MESGGVLSPSKQSSDPSMRNSLKDQPAIAQISSPHNSLAGDLSSPCELPSNLAPADQPIMFRRTKSALSQLSCTIFGASGSASPGNTTSSLAVETAAPNEDMMESGGVLSPSKQSSNPSMRDSLKDQPAIAQISSPHNSLAGDLSSPCELPSNAA